MSIPNPGIQPNDILISAKINPLVYYHQQLKIHFDLTNSFRFINSGQTRLNSGIRNRHNFFL